MLHENLYLPMEPGQRNLHLDDLDLDTSYLDQPPPLADQQTTAMPSQHLTDGDHDPFSTDTVMNQVPLERLSHERVAQWVNQTGAGGVGPSNQSKAVKELIAYGMKYNDEIDARSHNASFWRSMSPKVAICFQISRLEDRSRLLKHLAGLYLKHFEPLWPLFSPQSLDLYQMHPLCSSS
ncbi:hypothetical protein CLAIMM_14319 [Cladophialophora immunda]|nr:hypothetical protein CLAIMM_14319 [Cladophialophora immunda]